MSNSQEIERRVISFSDFEVREATEDEPPVIRGYAAVFNEWSEDLGGFVEMIEPGAFGEAISRDDVRALVNHDANYVLGRNTAGTLLMDEDDQGLRVVIMPPDTTWAGDLITSMKRGDINQMSFGFGVIDDEWRSDGGMTKRTLKELRLYDVSVVTYPAYPQTTVAVRSKVSELTGQGPGLDKAAEEAAASQGRRAARKRQLKLKKRGL